VSDTDNLVLYASADRGRKRSSRAYRRISRDDRDQRLSRSATGIAETSVLIAECLRQSFCLAEASEALRLSSSVR
jgi:hypothetical protein